jgi:hypothetical protein
MALVAAYCASRILVARIRHRATDYSTDAVHTAMGVAMAGMLTSRLISTTAWVAVFVAAAGWFATRAVRAYLGRSSTSPRLASHLRHIVTSGAMVYMLLANPATATAATVSQPQRMGQLETAARFPTLGLLLVAFLVGYTIVVTDRLSRASATAVPSEPGPVFAPRSVACCQIAMSITMGYMLLTLL